MHNLIPFQFECRPVRVITDGNGDPWFNAKEICDVIGFGNPYQALSTHVDSDDLQKLEVIDSMGRKQFANHINESGLYALIFGSMKEEAKRFKRWVTSEVLPSIRKTGNFGLKSIPKDFSSALRLAADQAEQIEKQQEALAIAAPKAEALDRMTLADGEVCLQTAGKLLQQRPNKFIEWLRSLGTWIFKRQGGRISAYSDKINAGYLNVRSTTTIMPDGSERVREQVVVTPKGLAKLALMLGVQPLEEMAA